MNPKSSRYYTYIRPIIRSKFAQTYSSLIFSLVTIFIFAFYAIRPTVTTILSLQKSIDEQTSVLERLQEKVRNLAQGKQNYENINQPLKTKLEDLVPDDPAVSKLINSLTYIAEQSEATVAGIQFQSINLEAKKSTPNKDAAITEIDFVFNTQGSFSSLMNVLTELKRNGRLVTIKSINFMQPPDSSLIMTVNGKAYYLKN